jgi:cbb3-type cytochrome oxidase maturation protein
MTSILYLIGISLSLGGLALAAFLWSLRNGQYEDMEGAANRILFEDAPPPQPRPARSGRSSAT